MSKHTKTISPEKVQEVIGELGPNAMVAFAKNVRRECRKKVANREMPFDAAALKEMDAIIKRMESQLN